MHAFGVAARKGNPFLEEEIEAIIKGTLVEMKAVNPVTGAAYSLTSDISCLLANFLARCEEQGVRLVVKAGRKLSMQRWMRSSWETLDQYVKKVASPALIAFQKKQGVKLGLTDVGNMDEAMIDVCEFAEKGHFLVLECFGNNIVVPFEQAPHLTLKWGFIGEDLMICMMIKIGPAEGAPHPYHCQLLRSNRNLVLAQSVNGWTNVGLTTAFFKLQVAPQDVETLTRSLYGRYTIVTRLLHDCYTTVTRLLHDCYTIVLPRQVEHPDVPIGPHRPKGATADAPLVTKPKVINMDGHSAHIYNDDIKKIFAEQKVLTLSPPAHTTAPSTRLPGTQQADANARDGGGIARFKMGFRPDMCKQFRHTLNRDKKDGTRGHVSSAEILAMVEKNLLSTWDPTLAAHLNETVGYFINAEGFLDYDVLRKYRAADGSCDIPGEDTGAATSGAAPAAPAAPSGTRGGLREVRMAQQKQTNAALDKVATLR
jgi:hypothetical protein